MVRTVLRQIQHRQAVDGDSEAMKVVGDEPGAVERGSTPRFPVSFIERTQLGAAGICTPVRRLEALHAPPFLVDEHRSIGAADAIAEVADQGFDLVGRPAVTLKKNESPGFGRPEESTFRI